MNGRAKRAHGYYESRKEDCYGRIKNSRIFERFVSFIEWRKRSILN